MLHAADLDWTEMPADISSLYVNIMATLSLHRPSSSN